MRLGLQAKPLPDAGELAINRQYSEENGRSVYAFSETVTLTTGNESFQIELGRAPYAGSVVGVAIEASQARTAGTIVADLLVNAVSALTATIDGTNTTKHVVGQATGIDTISANQALRLDITATGFTPVTTDVRVIVMMTNEESVITQRAPAFLRAEVDPSSSPTINASSPVIFDLVAQQVGDEISLDPSTGGFTLKGGNTYLVAASIVCNNDIDWQLYDKTGAAVVAGTQGHTINTDSGAALNAAGGGGVSGIVAPGSDTEYEIRNVSGSAGSLTNANGANTCLLVMRIA